MTESIKSGWLQDMVALVTGGASGIGEAVVDRYVAEGARVCILDRDEDAISESIDRHQGVVTGICGDVRSIDDNQKAADTAVQTFGGLDVFVGNAGVFDFSRPIEKYDPQVLSEAFDEMFAINVKGYLIGTSTALPALRESRSPSIILTVSNSGLYAGGGGPLYVASKHAVVGLVRQLAFELAPEIRVNGVAPGGTVTRLSGLEATGKENFHLDEIESASSYISRGLPLGFTPKPEDHAGAYVLLASPENARAITGAVLPSDGGMEVRGGGRRKNK